MKTKIISLLALVLLTLIGGSYFFIQTQSDFILKKISTLVEEATGAPLILENLPSIGIIPSASITLGKTSWGTEDFSVTFDKAKVGVSFFALLSGQVSLSALELKNPHVIYNDTTTAKPAKKDEKNEKGETVHIKQSISDIFTKILNTVPNDIRIKNGYMKYADKNQNLIVQNINTTVDNFELNKNAKTNISSEVIYTMMTGKNTHTYDFTIDTNFNFIFVENDLNLELTKFLINPKSGFNFSDKINLSASTEVLLSPFRLRSFAAQVDSPFITAKIDQFGDINYTEGSFNIIAKLFPLKIAKTFAPHKKFQNTKELEETNLNASVTFKDNVINLQNFKVLANESIVESTLTYDITKNKLFGDIDIANIPISHFIPENISNEKQSKSTNKPQSSTSTRKKINPDIKLPVFLQKTHFNVNLNASNIQYNEIRIDSVKTRFQGDNSVLSMNPIKIETMKSSILAKLTMDLTKKQKINTSVDIPFIDLNIWSKALLGNAMMSGTSSIKSSLSFPIVNPINNINGNGEIKLSSLYIQTKHIPFIVKLLQANKIKAENYKFTKGYVPFNINKSIVHLNNAYLSSSSLDVKTSGYINLKNENLNLNAQVNIGQTVSIPVSIKGNIQDPKVRLSLANPIKTIDNLFNLTIREDTGKKIDHVLNKLFGNKFF